MAKKLGLLLTKNCPSKVGIFDSGIGGVSILNELLTLPISEFVYFADTAYLPYGEKTTDFLVERAKKIIRYFKNLGITTVVIACHTSAVTSLDILKQEFPEITFIDPLPMTTENAVKITKNGRIAVMATERTINTGVHKKLLLRESSTITILEQSCPLLVPLIENNGPQEELERAVELYADKIKQAKSDTLILGCTHYPLISAVITKYLPKILLVSAASAIKRMVDLKDIKPIKNQVIRFIVSGDAEKIKSLLDRYIVRKNGIAVLVDQLEKSHN